MSAPRAVHWDCGAQCSTCVGVRLWQQVEPAGDCWIFRGPLDEKGYGRFRVDGKHQYAHRVAYRQMVAEVPEGLTLDHLCRTPACVRPDHLDPVPTRVNTMRGYGITAQRAASGHCARQGHPFTPENTYVTPQGHRSCRTCRRETQGNYKRRKRALVAAHPDHTDNREKD